MTEDQPALRQLMRLRGFGVMSVLLEDFDGSLEVPALVLECMVTWPLITRNKIEDSKIEEPVRKLIDSTHQELKELAQKVRFPTFGFESLRHLSAHRQVGMSGNGISYTKA